MAATPQPNPRAMVRDLARGTVPHRPIIAPLVFTLAAKVEGIPPRAFLSNPTKLSNSLKHVYDFLHPDAVVCHFGSCLEAEAIGCQLNWSTYPPTIARSPYQLGKRQITETETLAGKGRMPVALDVTRRLRATLREQAALLVGISGPGALAAQLYGKDVLRRVEEGLPNAEDALEQCGRVALQAALSFCQAGADIVFIVEQVPEEPRTQYLRSLESVLSPVCNVIHFHEALPVLSLSPFLEAHKVDEFSDLAEDVLLCLRLQDASAPRSADFRYQRPYALTVPTSRADSGIEEQPRAQEVLFEHEQCALVTTEDEIPYESDIGQLERLAKSMRSLVRHTGQRGNRELAGGQGRPPLQP